MAVTDKDLKELAELTVKDCPLPSVADVLCAVKPDDMDIMLNFNFIRKHYTEEQIEVGIAEFLDRVKMMNKLFGVSDGRAT